MRITGNVRQFNSLSSNLEKGQKNVNIPGDRCILSRQGHMSNPAFSHFFRTPNDSDFRASRRLTRSTIVNQVSCLLLFNISAVSRFTSNVSRQRAINKYINASIAASKFHEKSEKVVEYSGDLQKDEEFQ